MFATKGRLKVALFVIGVLLVGLGMYAAFQVQDVEANDSSWTCIFKTHSYDYKKTYPLVILDTITVHTNCSECSGQPATIHDILELQPYMCDWEDWDHQDISQPIWRTCHDHLIAYGATGSAYTETVKCGG